MGTRNTMGVSIFDGINLPGGRAGELLSTTGKVLYVGSVAVPGGVVGVDDAALGDNPRQPYATVDFGYGQLAASRGDVLCVLPNHAETVTTAITLDIVGATIVGLGVGTNRPTVTVSGTIDGVDVTAAGNTMHNLEIVEVADATSFVNIAAADFTLSGCYLNGAAIPEIAITVTAAGDRFIIEDCYFYASADGINNVVGFEGQATDWTIRRCIMNYGAAGIDEGVVQSSFDCEGGVWADTIVIGADLLVFDFNSSVNAEGDGILTGIRVAAGAPIADIEVAIDHGGYNAVDVLLSDLVSTSGGRIPVVTPA